jgi:hypothetical protein
MDEEGNGGCQVKVAFQSGHTYFLTMNCCFDILIRPVLGLFSADTLFTCSQLLGLLTCFG